MKGRFIPRSYGWGGGGGSPQTHGTAENERKAKYYSITKSGRKQLARETPELGADHPGDRGPVEVGRSGIAMIHYFRALAARLQALFGDRRADRELDDEIETHLRLLTERYVRQGMTEAEAARSARRQFGNVTLLEEVHREMRGIRFIETLLQDLRYGVRMLVKNPGFTSIAVITLSLGIGTNTAIFSLVNAVLLRSLSFPRPERIMTIWAEAPADGITKQSVAPGNYSDLKARQTVFAQMA